MNLTTCPYEKELRQLIARGQWPDACPAGATRARERLPLVRRPGADFRCLPPRACRVARRGAAGGPCGFAVARATAQAQCRRWSASARPLLGAQIFACAVTVFAALGFAGFEARSGVAWLSWGYWHDWFAQLPQAAAAQWASLSAGSQAGSAWSWMVLLPALATLLLLGGAAVYFATDKS